MSPRDGPGDEFLVDRLCDRFESAWQSGARPDLESWLPAEAPLRPAALVELACIDLEWRLRGGEPARVEDYLCSFPELRCDPDGLLRLVAHEARLRCGREGGPAAEDFLRRFPDLAALTAWESVASAACRAEPAADSVAGGATTDDRRGQGTAFEPPNGEERLRLGDEIGRGGMGLVIRGSDDSLGRDVAVKVLLEKYAGEPEMARRLLEEARITGQLQHPAIVPVHDVGRLPDGRPFFTMKLIRGRRLIDLLDERSDPTQDRPRLLKVFEQVCQALAYAHSKRVVHRDLKPHNVMVGAFGEVQVMDWGLAKVLQSGGAGCEDEEAASVIRKGSDEGSGSATEEGAVMGTAAYMPPEQARGEVQDIDARSDLFGLGAMLCHILTGLPAFPGPSKEAMRRARAGDLADAFSRLDGCGADAELVGLAKRCLAPDQANRPADAGVLAEELTAYLESVEARLRQAELDRAKAELKATEERRRRKAQLAAAVALLLLVVGGRRRLAVAGDQRLAAAAVGSRASDAGAGAEAPVGRAAVVPRGGGGGAERRRAGAQERRVVPGAPAGGGAGGGAGRRGGGGRARPAAAGCPRGGACAAGGDEILQRRQGEVVPSGRTVCGRPVQDRVL
jgi:hypothetical protein